MKKTLLLVCLLCMGIMMPATTSAKKKDIAFQMYSVRSLIGDAGKFVALIILVLQLAASGGTFPVETIASGFRWLNPLLPMTYSINLVKESVISVTDGVSFANASVLIGFLIVSILITTTYDPILQSKTSQSTPAVV